MASVYITDPESSEFFNLGDFQFSMLSVHESSFPCLIVGSAIRIHHMIVEEYNGDPTGTTYTGIQPEKIILM
jgi:hypothetical protein